ncbi:carbohydrate-binding domain-containing protein, partial [Porcipelethomonas sp.]|uniref:carbohydrate-binding domain-containing protein n=1 Tax=Porcipelethomonas sp. TaxID=2981675 RepID=UPI003EF9E391
SNGNVEINGGDLTLSSGDDGIHADETVAVNGGNIVINTSYEGIEGKIINIEDGIIEVTASDDGFNASDGSGDSMTPGNFEGTSSECELNINGGSIYVNAGGDGLDSNGIMNVNGGTTIVDGPENSGNGALDSGSEVIVNGGILIAAGSSGMAETPSENSGQYSIAVSFEQMLTSSESVCLKDSDGNVILSYQPAKQYSSLIISTPELKSGSEYSIYYGGKNNSDGEHGFITGGSYTGGELLDTVTLDSKLTSAGTGILGQMGGGMHQRGNFNPGEDDENLQPDDENGKNFPANGEMEPPDNGGVMPGNGGGMPDNGEFPDRDMQSPPDTPGI